MTINHFKDKTKKQISYYPTLDWVERLDSFAKEEGRKRANVIDGIIKDWFNTRHKKLYPSTSETPSQPQQSPTQ